MSSTKESLTRNDRRVLDAVRCAQVEWDGFIPHGPADHIGIKRLLGGGLVESIGFAVCQTCAEQHEAGAFITTSAGGAQ